MFSYIFIYLFIECLSFLIGNCTICYNFVFDSKNKQNIGKAKQQKKSTQDTQIGLIHEYFLTTKEIKVSICLIQFLEDQEIAQKNI